MNKFLFLFPILLTACDKEETNLAELMVKSQVPSADCVKFPSQNGISIAVCTVNKNQGVAVYSVTKPFQFFILKDAELPKEAPPVAPGEGSGSHAPLDGGTK